MGQKALQQKAMNLRDQVGPNAGLPPMPRHIDLLPDWIVQAQSVAMQMQSISEDFPSTPHGLQPPNRAAAYSQQAAYSHYDENANARPEFRGEQEQAYRAYPDDDRYSDAGAQSNSGAQAPGDMLTEKQLWSMSKASMKNRAMDLRDRVGIGNCPSMPRHAELLPDWIMAVQAMAQNGGAGPNRGAFDRAENQFGGGSRPQSSQPNYSQDARSDVGSSMNAGEERVSAARQIRDKNMGSNIFG